MLLKLLSTALALGAAPAPGPCLLNPDTTAILSRQIRQTFSYADSTYAARGLPVRVEEIRPVHDDSLCAAAMAALTARGSAQARPTHQALYVFELDNSAYVVTPAGSVNVYIYFDRRWNWLAGLVALD